MRGMGCTAQVEMFKCPLEMESWSSSVEGRFAHVNESRDAEAEVTAELSG